MANQNHVIGNEGSVRSSEGNVISNNQTDISLQNITSEVAVSVRGMSVTAKGYDKTLKDVIGKKTSSEYKTTLLIQISHCLLRLEKNQTPLVELLPSEIFIREMELANEKINNIGRKLAKTFFQILTGKELKSGKPVLSEDDCEDRFTAQDLIEQMITDEDFSIKDVLQHPFFWSKQDKINFICQAYDRIVPQCKIENKPELRKTTKRLVEDWGIDVKKTDIIPDKGWIEKLTLLKDEISEIMLKKPTISCIGIDTIRSCAIKKDKKNSGAFSAIKVEIVNSDKSTSCPIEIKPFDEKNTGPINIKIDKYDKGNSCAIEIKIDKSENTSCPIIVEIEESDITPTSCAIKIGIEKSNNQQSTSNNQPATSKMEIEMFDKNSIFDLLRFFRLHHAHYWEKNIIIRIAFGDYNDGYWNFYQRRFPKLLIHVYRAMKRYFDNDDFSKNIAHFRYLQKNNES